jgi:uncharacterized protein (DUF1810 family)
LLDSEKFLTAQAPVIDEVLVELRAGRKRTHWMWFIFPQLRALGRSATARHFGLSGLQDARVWLAHPVLGPRLLEGTRAVLLHPGMPIRSIMGSPDDLKLRSCMTLFQQADPAQPLFSQALTVFYGGQPDALTLELLGAKLGADRVAPAGDQ